MYIIIGLLIDSDEVFVETRNKPRKSRENKYIVSYKQFPIFYRIIRKLNTRVLELGQHSISIII